MTISIKAKNFDLTDELKDLVEKKLGGLAKFSQKIQGIKVVLQKKANHAKGDIFKVETILNVPGTNLFAEVNKASFNECLDSIKDLLQRDLKKYSGKKRREMKKQGFALKQ